MGGELDLKTKQCSKVIQDSDGAVCDLTNQMTWISLKVIWHFESIKRILVTLGHLTREESAKNEQLITFSVHIATMHWPGAALQKKSCAF